MCPHLGQLLLTPRSPARWPQPNSEEADGRQSFRSHEQSTQLAECRQNHVTHERDDEKWQPEDADEPPGDSPDQDPENFFH